MTAWRRGAFLLVMALLACTLAACSLVRVAYNQADWVSQWWLERALDLSDEQSAQARKAIDEWFAWHRQSQLPRYAQFLERAQQDAGRPISPAQACQRRDEIEALIRADLMRGVPAAASLVITLTPAQLDHLQGYWDKSNKSFRKKYLRKDPEERQEAAVDFASEWVEFFYGRMNRDQRERLAQDVARLPFDAQGAYEDRLRQQRQWMQAMRQLTSQHATQAQAEQAVARLIDEGFHPTQEPQRSRLPVWIKAGCEMSAALHARSTPEQRRTLTERLRGWEDDLRMLATQSPDTPVASARQAR